MFASLPLAYDCILIPLKFPSDAPRPLDHLSQLAGSLSPRSITGMSQILQLADGLFIRSDDLHFLSFNGHTLWSSAQQEPVSTFLVHISLSSPSAKCLSFLLHVSCVSQIGRWLRLLFSMRHRRGWAQSNMNKHTEVAQTVYTHTNVTNWKQEEVCVCMRCT